MGDMMPSRETLLRAAEIIERTADKLKRSAIICRTWQMEPSAAKTEHNEMLAIANELRRAAG
jgi:hypothetical protein